MYFFKKCGFPSGAGPHGSPRVSTGPHGSSRVSKKTCFFLFSPLENAFLRVKYTPKIGIFELPIRGRGPFQIVTGIIFCPTRYVYVYICYCHSESDVLVCKRKSQKQSPWSPPVATTKIYYIQEDTHVCIFYLRIYAYVILKMRIFKRRGSPRVSTGPHGSSRVSKKACFFLFSPLGNAFLRVKYTPKIGVFELPIRSRGPNRGGCNFLS